MRPPRWSSAESLGFFLANGIPRPFLRQPDASGGTKVRARPATRRLLGAPRGDGAVFLSSSRITMTTTSGCISRVIPCLLTLCRRSPGGIPRSTRQLWHGNHDQRFTQRRVGRQSYRKSASQVTFRSFPVGRLWLNSWPVSPADDGKKEQSNFVAQWAPTLLILGRYNKIVKVAGSD